MTDNEGRVTLTGTVLILSVILSCLIMLQLTAITYLAKAQLSAAVVTITDNVQCKEGLKWNLMN